MKKLTALLLCAVLALGLCAPALAAPAFEDDVMGIYGLLSTPPAPDGYFDDYYDTDWEWDEEEYLRGLREEYGMPYADGINVSLNGEYLTFPSGMPQIRNGRTMLPLRAVMEAMGGEVFYENGEITADFDGGRSIEMTVDDPKLTVTVNGFADTLEMDAAPFVENGVTYVPVRFVSQALGAEVYWDDYLTAAHLVDWNAFADAVDADFTSLNAVLQALPKPDAEKSLRTQESISLKGTLYGDESDTAASISVKGDLRQQGGRFNGVFDVAMDMAPLEELLRPNMGDDAWNALVSASGKYTLLGDMEAGHMYARSTNSAQLTDGALPNGTWLTLVEDQPFENFGEYMEAVDMSGLTIGTLLADEYQSRYGDYFYGWESPWTEAMAETVVPLRLVLDDSAFIKTQSAGKTSYVCDMDILTLWQRASDMGLTEGYTLADVFGGNSPSGHFKLSAQLTDETLTAFTLKGTARLNTQIPMTVTFDISADESRLDAAISLKGDYVGKIELSMKGSSAAAPADFQTAPSAGDLVLSEAESRDILYW